MAEGRAGFTLIELLVALVIGSLVVGVLLQLVSGQARFVQGQSAREEVQQNSRAALELIGSELRSLSSGASLVRAAADSLTLRTPRVWGSVCSVPGGTTLEVAFPVVAGLSFAVNAGTGLVVNLGTPTSPIWSTAVSVMSVSGAGSTCGGTGLPAGVERRTFTLSGTPINGATGPVPGNVAYVYDQVTYRTGTSSGVPGTWIQRRIGEGAGVANQPMAGPIGDDEGLSFVYYADGSSVPLSTPIVDAAVRGSVSRIAIIVEAVSRGDETTIASRTDTVLVPLRNRRF